MSLFQKRVVELLVFLLCEWYPRQERFQRLVDHVLLLLEMLIQERMLLIEAFVHEDGLGAEHLGRIGKEAEHDEHVLIVLVYLGEVAQAAEHHGVRILQLIYLLLELRQKIKDRHYFLFVSEHILLLVKLLLLRSLDLLIQKILPLKISRCVYAILVRCHPVNAVHHFLLTHEGHELLK